jgi:hypothetical protein
MSTQTGDGLSWQKSRRSNNSGNCVEIAPAIRVGSDVIKPDISPDEQAQK